MSVSGSSASEETPSFLSLGLLVLDELRFPSKPTLFNVVGGSGAYSGYPTTTLLRPGELTLIGTLGARLTAAAAQSKRVACVLLVGDDFPDEVLHTLQEWDMRLDVRRMHGKKSTRGLLQYEDESFGRKTFRYLTTPLQLQSKDLENSPFLQSAGFHFLVHPSDLESQVADLHSCRARRDIWQKPLVVWEPAPPHCNLSNQDAHFRACKQVDVFSPNHLELIRLFEDQSDPGRSFDRSLVEKYAKRFLDTSLDDGKDDIIIVIRAGEHGCMTLSSTQDCTWLEPFYNSRSSRVVDPTGAGNCFLGAFTTAFLRTRSVTEAAIHGTVAASFALEQVGLSTLCTVDGREMWNDSTFADRLEAYRKRISWCEVTR